MLFLKKIKPLRIFSPVKWLFQLFSGLSLIWFFIRVIPKPSRINYPCIRTTFPFASYFVGSIAGLLGSSFIFRRAKTQLRRSQFIFASISIIAAVFAAWLSVSGLIETWISGQMVPGLIAETKEENNLPIGVAKGIQPGRVVWVHNPEATDWEGPDSGVSCWEEGNINQAIIDNMLSKAIRWLAEKHTISEAWDALFSYINTQRGRGFYGYQDGEKIVIKVNLTLSNASGIENPSDRLLKKNLDKAGSTNPQVILSILRQLVNAMGVNQTDISVGDTVTYFPQQWYDYLVTEFPNVNYLDHYPYQGRKQVAFSTIPFYWSTADANDFLGDFLPSSYVDADYIINIPVLKSHGSSGITLSAKNHFGSLIRAPDGDLWGETKDYYLLHENLPLNLPGMGKYRCLVDLMGHEDIGGKTVLYLVDALFAGQTWKGTPQKWEMPPFNGDWPSSLFVSQDPVAIDSVGYDFLTTEWPDAVANGSGGVNALGGGAQDYLHEAALANNPPSGTFYDPERDGISMDSLGVHEHWNNPLDKEYSRNLGNGEGIELIDGDTDNDAIDKDIDNCPTTNNPNQTDSDNDTVGDFCDNCPNTFNTGQIDTDGDGAGDLCDNCPDDPNKTEEGICGCGVADTETNNNGIPDCLDFQPVATITSPDSDQTIIVGESVNFQSSVSSGNAPFTYLWDFDGGATNSTEEDPGNIRFDNIGEYDVTLTVTDNNGDTNSDDVMITVEAVPSGDDEGNNGDGGGGGGCFINILYLPALLFLLS